jgi:superfamily I DNA/RNA helicase
MEKRRLFKLTPTRAKRQLLNTLKKKRSACFYANKGENNFGFDIILIFKSKNNQKNPILQIGLNLNYNWY